MHQKDRDSHQQRKRGTFNQIIEWFSPFRRKRRTGDTADLPTPPFLSDGASFTEFDLSDPVRRGIKDAGFVFCTPIQELALPITLEGKDIAAQAQTGTGKTAAFLITLFERLLRIDKRKPGVPSARSGAWPDG